MSDSVKVSIICLIFKSTGWLQFLYDQLLKHTDMTDAEFYFVANDATPEVLRYLKKHDIPHYVYENTPEQKKQFYMCNVYRAYNYGVSKAKGEYVLLLNSDMAFTPNWLPVLMSAITPNTCVCPRLIESGRFKSGKYGITGKFGESYKNYNEQGLLTMAKARVIPEIHRGGLYGPLLILKEHFDLVGGYPEGNIHKKSTSIWEPEIPTVWRGDVIPGDEVLMRKLAHHNIVHMTTFHCIIYHFQSGESSSTD